MAGRLGRVGPYVLLERLGRGGMGEVYLAASRRGERVALKLLRDPVDDPAARLRLEREVRALRRVNSLHVAKVLDAHLSGDRPYLVMEYIEGETLLEAVRRGGPLPEPELIRLAQRLAAALAVIHAAGIVHRDVKPANVLLAERGPVLIDFGIAQVVDATRVTETGTFLGTPGYSAPELFANQPAGQPADVHAWAATVAFAATGRPTFGEGSAEAQMYAILNGKADLAGVPPALLPLIRAALHRDPARRPTAAVLADRLARLARAVGDPQRRIGPAAVRPARPHRPVRVPVRPTVPAARERQPEGAGQAAEERALRAEGGAVALARPRDPADRRARAGESPAEAVAQEATAAEPVEPTKRLRRPGGHAALAVLALLAVPGVVVSVIYPLATFAITAASSAVVRALWVGHWLVRRRSSPRTRLVLRALTFPLLLAGSLVTVVCWPGLPAAIAGFATLWAVTGTGQLPPEWWTQVMPVTIAGFAFGAVSALIIGREVERAGASLPALRRTDLRTLALLGGFVALCSLAVQAVSLVV
ncbi:serine/threonine-protein kinase [Thermobispora bispora]|uniref:Serine/threonine protein kinase n=1 Tax=Thermobispora bispora (strain ATCC 19993 / DSM 43833 / CBS 139.67 / JCM 10125 / KCTC 9307 / NBRC 14880 / R51) TaxID=469371 RepID=D6Y4I2_THEBD|nr:serine/threonine-protein kinase [Thermobispora bispora]ADG89158.1 serine/threonine protein kinase [Thermobispora bispora DSM 43833]